jgi:hypothetical protein
LFDEWKILSANKAGKQHYYWNILIGFYFFSKQTGFELKKIGKIGGFLKKKRKE